MTSTDPVDTNEEGSGYTENRISSPTSSTSGCLSGDDSSVEERQVIPTALLEEELQLAINKEATSAELEQAIARCKELVLESEQCSSERKWLVRHLIELRLRLQECIDALSDPSHPRNHGSSVTRRVVLGHHLQLQPFLSAGAVVSGYGARHLYCDQCAGTIWSVLQAWYRCSDCGYNCHHKCLGDIVRVCAHVTATERGSYINEICPEKGLSSQRYRCAECTAPLTFTGSSWAEARLCDYDGLYYCTGCHWNSLAVVPARVIHNWDMEKRPVSQASAQLLRLTAHRPLIHLEQLNPRLFDFIHELADVKRLRALLAAQHRYLAICRLAKEERLEWRAAERQHLLDTTHMYSLQDLLDIHTGELPDFLQELADNYTKHIKNCVLCRARGHLCEICGNDEIFFPFEAGVVSCSQCNACFHRACFIRKKDVCPKCIRLQQKTKVEECSDNLETLSITSE